jgi:citrate lyase subunit alpha/citrate CoA-transferase
VSIATSLYVKALMAERKVQDSFGAGGVTGYLVEVLEARLFRTVFDVQCFDLRAVESYRNDRRHQAMSASLYANPHNRGPLVEQLDAMLLGAAEVDLDFNVNVTTGTSGVILGGSGGHSDTAPGAKLAIVATRLAANVGPKIVERVGSITTPGETVDVLVTEAGVAVHPRREDLRDRLSAAGIELSTVEQLHARSLALCPGVGPQAPLQGDRRIVGVVEYRDGSIIDVIRQVHDA